MSLAAVCSREIDGEVVTFGTTGFTYDRTFVLYDRKTESVWYPYKSNELNALSGHYAGKALPWLSKTAPVTLADWRDEHADTLVLVRN